MIGALIIQRKVPGGFKALENHDLDAYLKDWADKSPVTLSPPPW